MRVKVIVLINVKSPMTGW